MKTLDEDGAVVGSPANQTAGVKGPVAPIKQKNIFKRVQELKKKNTTILH